MGSDATKTPAAPDWLQALIPSVPLIVLGIGALLAVRGRRNRPPRRK
jgi:hypothetical protein